jgi:2',3'-cyclic-nucleotide 2'-phosphodiesterase (5'-nucleotidase family)
MFAHVAAVLAALLILLVPPARAGQEHLRILHLNDFHGFARPHQPPGAAEPLGGIAYLAARVQALRAGQPTLLLAAGDMIQGHNWANLSRGASVIETMNAMGFDAMALGNHELDFGQAALAERAREARFPFLAANVEGLDPVRPYIVRTPGGVRVAVIGLATPETPQATHPGNVAGLRFEDPALTLQRLLPELRRQSDLVVVLAHLGHAAERRLAQEVEGIDVLIGGHSHTRVTEPPTIAGTLVAQAWEHGKALGVIDLTVEDGRIVRAVGRLEDIRPGGAPQPEVEAIVARWDARAQEVLGQRVGEAGVDLDVRNARSAETNFGNLVADLLRRTAGADAALVNGGALRAGIRRGTVKAGDLYTALPFDNYLVAVRMSGRQLLAALEHGVAAVESRDGRFPQVSGLSFSYAPAAAPGARVRQVRLGDAALDPARTYVVATLDFLAAGGDGYAAFGEAIRGGGDFVSVGGAVSGSAVAYSDPGRWLRDLVIEHWRRQGMLAPGLEGRIREVE